MVSFKFRYSIFSVNLFFYLGILGLFFFAATGVFSTLAYPGGSVAFVVKTFDAARFVSSAILTLIFLSSMVASSNALIACSAPARSLISINPYPWLSPVTLSVIMVTVFTLPYPLKISVSSSSSISRGMPTIKSLKNKAFGYC